jgi:hypothetical protein
MILLLSGHQELAPKQNRRTNQGGGYFAEENFCSVKFFPLRIDRETCFAIKAPCVSIAGCRPHL